MAERDRRERRTVNFFIIPFLYWLSRSAVRVTTTLGNDCLVSDDDRPTAAGEQEPAEGFEILLTIYESGGAVISLWPRESASVCGDESAFVLDCGHI